MVPRCLPQKAAPPIDAETLPPEEILEEELVDADTSAELCSAEAAQHPGSDGLSADGDTK